MIRRAILGAITGLAVLFIAAGLAYGVAVLFGVVK